MSNANANDTAVLMRARPARHLSPRSQTSSVQVQSKFRCGREEAPQPSVRIQIQERSLNCSMQEAR